jgi:hypothetical protein
MFDLVFKGGAKVTFADEQNRIKQRNNAHLTSQLSAVSKQERRVAIFLQEIKNKISTDLMG